MGVVKRKITYPPLSPGSMQIYLKQIALFGLIGQCICSKCPKIHIQNLVESSAGNNGFPSVYSTKFFICSSWDLSEMHCAIKLNKAISLGSAKFLPIIPGLHVSSSN